MSAAVLAATGVVPVAAVDRRVLLGGAVSDGSARGIRGTLPAVLATAPAGHPQAVVRTANADESALADGVELLSVANSRGVAELLAAPEPVDLP